MQRVKIVSGKGEGWRGKILKIGYMKMGEKGKSSSP